MYIIYMARAVQKTEGTVFPNTDRPWLVNNILIFLKPNKWLRKEPECSECTGRVEYCPLSEPITFQDL